MSNISKQTFVDIIESDSFKNEIRARMPAHINENMIIAQFRSAFRKNQKLLGCTKVSMYESLVTAAQLGVDVSSDDAYLIPRFDRQNNAYNCDFKLDYKGLLKIAYRAGVKRIEMQDVYKNDEFTYQTGTNVNITYSPCLTSDRGPMIAVYALAELKDGSIISTIMSKHEVDNCMRESKNSTVWNKWYGEMAKKSAVHRLGKNLKGCLEDARFTKAMDVIQHELTQDSGNQYKQIKEVQHDDSYTSCQLLITEAFNPETLALAASEVERCKDSIGKQKTNQLRTLIKEKEFDNA